jgi:catechol 2,3-dioxygenase-like lactoylglutathione lyase family enzyme
MQLGKAEDVAYVRFSAPDLSRMASFLEDFGMVRVESTESGRDTLYMRGSAGSPFVHATELGAPEFLALGLRARSMEDLEYIADIDRVAIERSTAPGKGLIAKLTDPDGLRIEVVFAQGEAPPLPVEAPTAWNNAHGRPRVDTFKRTGSGAATVIRLGHCVLSVSDFRKSEAWYKHRFGLITSDEIAVSDQVSIGAFLRCDLGNTPTDHHTIALVQSPKGAGLGHAAFEVSDIDNLMRGHQHLKARGAHAEWGVGRHVLGSQVFDYWRDPWGFTLEHWTDGDLLTADLPSKKANMDEVLAVQWGPSMPPTFV